MTWIPLLLTDPSPCLRYLVLTELLERSESDKEVRELLKLREFDPLVKNLFKLQKPNGSWDSFDLTRVNSSANLQISSMVLQRLGYFGFDSNCSVVYKGAEYIFSKQQEDGSWPIPGKKDLTDEEYGYQMMPVQTAIPLLGLVMCGYADDKRSENAFDWLIQHRLKDGAWPVGLSSGNYGGIAGYRRLAHSRWGCRSNTTAVLSCLAYHPKFSKSEEATRALDLLLGTNSKQRTNLGFMIARILGLERAFGLITYMARFDIAHVLNLCMRVGATQEDERILNLLEFVKSERGEYGLWENSRYPQVTRWLSFDLIRSLTKIGTNNDWLSFEPKTPFKAYSEKKKRF
jgi:hypothetical protein